MAKNLIAASSWIAFATATLVLSGCAGQSVRGPDSPFVMPSVGSMVSVNSELRVPVDNARVFLQSGRAGGWGGVDRYKPHCNFEIATLATQNTTILPGEFRVSAVSRFIEEVVWATPLKVASLRYAGLDDDSGHTNINIGVRMALESAEQPNVRALTCYGAEDLPPRALPPSIVQIKEALAPFAELSVR